MTFADVAEASALPRARTRLLGGVDLRERVGFAATGDEGRVRALAHVERDGQRIAVNQRLAKESGALVFFALRLNIGEGA